jgi:hypothetical protein
VVVRDRSEDEGFNVESEFMMTHIVLFGQIKEQKKVIKLSVGPHVAK